MQEKYIAVSATWNSPENSFSDKECFYQGKPSYDILHLIYLVYRFCWANVIMPNNCFDVTKNPSYDSYIANTKRYVKNTVSLVRDKINA